MWTFALAVLLTIPALADETKGDKVAQAEKAVAEQLKSLKAEGAQVTLVKDDAVAKAIPNHVFLAVHFRQFPVAIAPPAPLKSANLYAVGADGKPTLVGNPEDLNKYLQAARIRAETEDAMKIVFQSWMRLAQEFEQDGYYKFELVKDSVKVKNDQGAKVVTGTVVVMEGGSGKIEGTSNFDKNGQLATQSIKASITPGPRPRCHATKLLDADPVIRAIVEDDLLFMGRAAKPYLDEQRSRASTELKRAIDRIWQRIERGER